MIASEVPYEAPFPPFLLLFCCLSSSSKLIPSIRRLPTNWRKCVASSRNWAKLVSSVRGKVPDELLADAEIYQKAGEWILRYPEEFYTAAYVKQTLAVLDRGIARAKGQAKGPRRSGRPEPAVSRGPIARRWTVACSHTA